MLRAFSIRRNTWTWTDPVKGWLVVDATAKNDDERFDSDMVLMTAELARLLADLLNALGGEKREKNMVPGRKA